MVFAAVGQSGDGMGGRACAAPRDGRPRAPVTAGRCVLLPVFVAGDVGAGGGVPRQRGRGVAAQPFQPRRRGGNRGRGCWRRRWGKFRRWRGCRRWGRFRRRRWGRFRRRRGFRLPRGVGRSDHVPRRRVGRGLAGAAGVDGPQVVAVLPPVGQAGQRVRRGGLSAAGDGRPLAPAGEVAGGCIVVVDVVLVARDGRVRRVVPRQRNRCVPGRGRQPRGSGGNRGRRRGFGRRCGRGRGFRGRRWLRFRGRCRLRFRGWRGPGFPAWAWASAAHTARRAGSCASRCRRGRCGRGRRRCRWRCCPRRRW